MLFSSKILHRFDISHLKDRQKIETHYSFSTGYRSKRFVMISDNKNFILMQKDEAKDLEEEFGNLFSNNSHSDLTE